MFRGGKTVNMLIDETANRHGRLVVIKRAESKQTAACWLCKCDCGAECVVRGGNLRTGSGCLRRPPGAALRHLFANLRSRAKERGYKWALTREQFAHLTRQDCFYCGVEPRQIRRVETGRNGKPYVYNGLDRVDNERGYVLGNVVPCCGDCNYAKRFRTPEEFEAWIHRVHERLASI